jgi:hypothetical protein
MASVIAIVWSNVIVPSHESDSEYAGWYVVGYLGLFAYFALSGFLAARGGATIAGATLTGSVTAAVGVATILLTFIAVDNLFLNIVMQQPDKAVGFASSGLNSARDYVNQGLPMSLVAGVMGAAAIGALLGLVGGLLAMRLSRTGAAAA